MRYRVITILAGLSTLAALSGCSAQEAAEPAPATSSTSASTAQSAPSTSSTAAPAADIPNTGESDVECRTSQLEGSVVDTGDAGAGSTRISLVVTNTSDTECTLQGWPGVSFVGDGNGTQLGAAAEQVEGDAPTVTLAPEGSAQTTLTIVSAGNYEGCGDVVTPDGFRVYPPGETEALFIESHAYSACTGGPALLKVGSFVAS